MIRNLLLLCVAVLTASLTMAQTAPDDAAIERAVSDARSEFYYPNLFMRYMQGDSTLTSADYHHLYYGYAFQPTYHPLGTDAGADSVVMLFERNPNPTREDFEKLARYGREALQYDPFSPRVLNLMTYAYGELGDSIQERAYWRKMNGVMEAIRNSGNGLKESTAFHVLYFTHPLDLLISMNLKAGNRTVRSRTCEFINFITPDNKNRGFYFNFSRIYKNKPPQEEPKKRTMQFNGVRMKP